MGFSDWLSEKMKERNWSRSELARRSGISQPTISQVINKHQSPTLEFCIAVAHAFGVSEIDTLYKAGLITEKPAIVDQPMMREVAELALELTPEQRGFVVMFARMVKSGKIVIRIEGNNGVRGSFELESE